MLSDLFHWFHLLLNTVWLNCVDIVGTMLSEAHHSSDLLIDVYSCSIHFFNVYTGLQIPQHDIQNQSATKCLDVVRHAKGGLPIVKLNKLPKPGGILQSQSSRFA